MIIVVRKYFELVHTKSLKTNYLTRFELLIHYESLPKTFVEITVLQNVA